MTLLLSNGIRERIRVYGRTRQEARDKLDKKVEAARQGILLAERGWKVGSYLNYWLEREKRRPLTRQRHESISRLYLNPGLGRYRLDGLTVRIVQEFFDKLHATGTSIATIHQIRKVLSAALTYAMRQELLLRNVARLVELPRYRPGEAAYWTPDETSRFLEAARPDPLFPAFVLLALYGLRRGEVLGLRWCDVDFDRAILRIRQQIQRIGGQLRQVELKTDSSERDEPLLATARAALLQQRAAQAVCRAEVGPDWQGTGRDDELVFTTRTGRPLESHNLARSFLRICKQQHGLRRITLHGLRHSNATAQKNLDVHARDIQAILGHGDIRTTGIYQHVDLDSKQKALEMVEGRLFARGTGSVRCRQFYRQRHQIVVGNTTNNSGGSSQTRTGDTRLFRTFPKGETGRFTEVNLLSNERRWQWLLGCVAVNFAVNLPNR
ncbi:tyrosine-type recombinase/integrase [Fodinicola acaciae]|uniref:tyrosine-type recombinase/integrase n=1 Tax=Fodinicola acaciae TaxID=2681555 RepID=UPI0013D4CC7A|nr:site-specific integrase [Fodinicola acaciae]